MMKQYLAVDSGGSKVLAVLYDEEFRPIRTARTGSMRPNTTAHALIRQNADQLIDALGIDGQTLEAVDGILDAGLLERLRERCTVTTYRGCGELEAGLGAAGITGDGYLALSGTGATLFARWHGKVYYCGGYGAAVADEGSGYWMARNAFQAAIRAWEGRGPATSLTYWIAKELGYPESQLRDAIFSIYTQNSQSPTARVASCAPLVSRAAEAGDAVAISLLRETGEVLADQLIHMALRENLPNDLPVTISGSVWKSHPTLFAAFSEKIGAAGFRPVFHPAFEPVVGVILGHYGSVYGAIDDGTMQHFQKLYADFLYSIPAAKNV